MTDKFRDLKLRLYNNVEPLPDLACCSQCGGKFPVGMCETEPDGDWESGYYDVHVCPYCPDGGCIDDYDYTAEASAAWEKWQERNGGGETPNE